MEKEIIKHNKDMAKFSKIKQAAEVLRAELNNTIFEYDRVAVVTRDRVVFYEHKMSVPKNADISS